MTSDDIELAWALASVLDGPEMHALGPTDAALVVRCLRAAAAAAEVLSKRCLGAVIDGGMEAGLEA